MQLVGDTPLRRDSCAPPPAFPLREGAPSTAEVAGGWAQRGSPRPRRWPPPALPHAGLRGRLPPFRFRFQPGRAVLQKRNRGGACLPRSSAAVRRREGRRSSWGSRSACHRSEITARGIRGSLRSRRGSLPAPRLQRRSAAASRQPGFLCGRCH